MPASRWRITYLRIGRPQTSYRSLNIVELQQANYISLNIAERYDELQIWLLAKRWRITDLHIVKSCAELQIRRWTTAGELQVFGHHR